MADAQFACSISEQYDKYLEPLLFEFSAKDLAHRVNKKAQDDANVLEIACGTVVSTKYLRKLLPGNVSIMATDL